VTADVETAEQPLVAEAKEVRYTASM